LATPASTLKATVRTTAAVSADGDRASPSKSFVVNNRCPLDENLHARRGFQWARVRPPRQLAGRRCGAFRVAREFTAWNRMERLDVISDVRMGRGDVLINRRRILAAGGLGLVATVAGPSNLLGTTASAPASAAAPVPPQLTWVGTKKIAFLPVYRPTDTVPPDWAQQIERRVHFDPNTSGLDVSLRAFVRVTSYGRADLEGHILPAVEYPNQNIPVGAFAAEYESSLRSQGFHGAFLVTLGGPGAGSAFLAGFWARVAMAEGVGVWAMEILHAVVGYNDLYIYPDHLDVFDNMAANIGTHPSAFTKRIFGWLDDARFTRHIGRLRTYDLQTLALAQPPPPGRHTAVHIGGETNYFLVEARQGVDQFDNRISASRQGVIVYQVENPDTDSNPNTISPRLLLRTFSGLKAGQLYVSPSGVDVRVINTFNGGFTVRVLDPTVHLINRSGEFGTPTASLRPASLVVPGLGVDNIIYRDTSGQMHELWRDATGRTGTTNLTANAGAPTAVGEPTVTVHQPTNTQTVLYRSSGGVVRSLYWSTGAVGHDNLSGTAGAPPASSDPIGYRTAHDDTYHVIYRTSNGHLHELFSIGNAPVGYGGDISAAARAVNAVGNPSAYADPLRGTNIIIFRGTDNHIRSLYWDTGAVGHEDLSGFAGLPNAVSDPFAYYTPHDDVGQIVYLGANGHVYELYWQGVNAVAGWDLSAAAGAPPASSSLTGYYDPGTHTKHVYYVSTDGRVHELWWTPGGGTPAHRDLTSFAAAPPAASPPTSFVTQSPNTQHVVYRATDGRIYEIAW
jgi:hypothetical protein